MLLDYLGTIDTLELRRHLQRTITEFVPSSLCARTVVRSRRLRGLDTLSAVGLAAEIGDFTRLKRAGQLMSCVGLVPAEHSAGQTHGQGQITKTGSRHARRLLGQAAKISLSSWPAPPLATPRRGARQAAHDRRGRRRPRTRRIPLGARPR